MIPNSYFIWKGICPCDPTQGQSCRHCDGTAADDREVRRHGLTPAEPEAARPEAPAAGLAPADGEGAAAEVAPEPVNP